MKNKFVNSLLIALFAFLIILKIVFIDSGKGDYLLINSIFWIIALIYSFKTIGFRKDNHICKYNSVQITVIGLMLFLIFTYLSGLFFGFLKNSYSLKLLDIIKNIMPVIIMITSEELIRWMVANKSRSNKLPLILLTIIFILFDIVLVYNDNVTGAAKIFVFIGSTCLTSIARNAFASYVTYRVSFVPGLLLRLVLGTYIYIMPIFPDYGNYISSVLGILFPYLIYFFITRVVVKAEKERLAPIRTRLWIINIPIIMTLLVLVILVAGLFKYKMIAIGSGSMEPVFYRGDTVILEYVDPNSVQIGDILVFKHDETIVTHRVKSKYYENDKFYFKTKGDNNKEIDNFVTEGSDVIGVVRVRVKYIGYPSLWIQSLFDKE